MVSAPDLADNGSMNSTIFLVLGVILGVFSLMSATQARNPGDVQVGDNLGELAAACIIAAGLVARRDPPK